MLPKVTDLAKTELEEAGESTEGMVESTATLRQEIMALSGIDIMLDKNNFKSTYQIMDELSQKWENLSDIQQATITELMAGKHQGNVFASLMTNFDTAREALDASLNSSGSAMREHAKWSESLEARLNKLKSTWQSLSQTFMNSDFLKGALDFITSLVNGLDKLIDTIGVVPTLLGAFGAGKFIMNITKLGGAMTSISDILDILKISFPTISRLGSAFFSGLSTSVATFVAAIASGTGVVAAFKAAFASLTATMSVNPIFAVAAAVGVVIAAYNKWKKSAEELAKKVEDVTSKYRDEHDALVKLRGDYDTSNEDSLISKYGKLSKGVNELGENVSLTSSEYSEYKGIVDTIANQFPSLVTGYNSQGDAILSCKGSVEELTQAYKDLILEQNKAVLDTGEDIFKDFENDLNKAKYKNHYEVDLLSQVSDLKKLVDGEIDLSDLSIDSRMSISKMLDENGIERDVLGSGKKGYENHNKHIRRALEENIAEVKSILEDETADLNAYSEELGEATNAYFSTAFLGGNNNDIGDYSHFSERMQNVINQVTSNFDSAFYAQFLDKENPYEALIEYYDSMLNAFDELGDTGTKEFEAAFNLRTQFNNGDITYGEYIHGIKNAEDLIGGMQLDDEIKNQIKLTLNTEEVQDEYDALKERLTSEEYDIKMKAEEAEEFLNSLSASEYQVTTKLVADGEIDLSKLDINSLKDYIEKEAALLDALNYTISIDVETESIDALNTAMAESVSGAGLSSEAISALKSRYAELEDEGYSLSSMFEETANGIHLNKKAVGEFEQKLSSNKLAETDKQLDVLKNRYDELATEIDNCKDASDRAALYTEQQSIVDKINDLATLASQYEGLTSAYNAWINADGAGSERDMYENIISGFETVEDEISRGWVDDGTIKFLELLTGKTDLASKSGKELKEIYNGLDDNIKNTTYSISDFFTVDKDGNSTSKGVYNFLNAVHQLEKTDKFKNIEGIEYLSERDENGKIVSFDFELVAEKDENGNVIKNGDQVIAEALGISEELVQIMLRAADDAGFVVNLEGAYTQLADLKTEAESARDTLIDLQKNGLENLKGVDVNFDLDAEGSDLVDEQEKAVKLLDKFKKDGKIDLTMEGAQQALDIAEYLTIKLDDLTEPKIMQIDVSEVDEDLRDPIEKMQEIVKLSKEKNLISLTGDKKEIKETQEEINKVAKELEDLNPEIKAKVGIDKNWSAETIASKIEKGEIEIPAELELDVQMSDDLKDIRLLMMGQLGLADKNEVKLKVSYDIDESTVDELTPEQQKVVVKFLAEDEDVKNYTPEQKTALVKYIADGGDLDGFTPEEKEAFVNYLVDGGSVEGYTPEDKKALAKYLVDGGDPDKYEPPSKAQEVKAELDSSEVDNKVYEDKTITVWAKLKKTWSNIKSALGIGEVNGTANVDGTAFANGTTGRAFKQGDWRTKKTETALTGELGQELVVTGNRWYTVGDRGAEFATIPKGSIVFNHRQTEELFKNGKVTSDGGRGRLLANGTAHASGTAFSSGSGNGIEPEVTSYNVFKYEKSKSKSSSSSSSDTTDEFEETLDWIEIAISRIEREIDNLDQKVNRTYKSWSSRNNALTSEISKVGDEIDLQQKAYERYLKEAESVGLSSSWASKVREGKVDIETITDEDLAEKIKNYQNWFEKALACKDAIEDLKDTEAELYRQRFDHIQAQYDGIIQGYEHTETMLNEYISQAEAQGHIISRKYYDALIKNEKQNIAELKKEQAALIAERDKSIADGKIEKYSEEWYAMCAEVDSVTQAIEEGTTSLIEYNNAIRDLDWEKFELIQERISDIAAESDFLIDLMSNDKLFDDKGKLTGQGAATMGLHALNHNTYMYQADDYGAKVAEIDRKIASGELDGASKDVLDKRKEYVELQRECILNAEQEKQSIADLVEEGINIELDSLQDLIDAKNEELEAEKDLYEYNKKVKEQTEEIASLRKQMAAYENDDSEEAKAKIQELKVSLEEAETELKETEWDKYIQDTSVLLDNLYTEYETILNARLDNVDFLLQQVIDGVNTAASLSTEQNASLLASLGSEGTLASALGVDGAIASSIVNAMGENGSIKNILNKEVTDVGTKLSGAMNNIWSVGEGNAKSVLTTYGEGFQGKQTTTNTTLSGIKISVDKMANASDKEAEKKVSANKTSTSAKKDPTKDSTPTKKPATTTNKTNTNKTSGDGKAKVGDKVKFVSGKYYYDSQGKKPLGSHNLGKEVYITSINTKSWATHPYHISTGKKLGSGDLGWLKLNQLSGYAAGKKNFSNNEIAWTQENGQEYIIRPSDGAILTPVAKGDSVLNATASGNIWSMANNPAEFIRDNLKMDASNVFNGANVQSNVTQHFENIVFSMPNVKNYDEMLSAMQKDKNFERLVLSLGINQIAGKSSLAKGKSIR